MTMQCAECRELIHAYVDGELPLDERRDVEQHIATCPECAGSLTAITELSRTLKEVLVRHPAPDVLKARIRSALAEDADVLRPAPARRTRSLSGGQLAAAAVLVAALSAGLAIAGTRRWDARQDEEQAVLASHLRSLVPGHLTDVASNDQHNVKPWFNGRLDLSPSVPRLDSIGFPLLGGRLDYVGTREAAAVVYGRRQHVINVYSWPESGADEAPSATTDHGYHLVRWRDGGIELWAASDVGLPELEQFVAAFRRAR